MSGVATDRQTGEKLSHVNIQLKGTTIGTATNSEGTFTLHQLDRDEVVLVASGVGLKTIEQSVALIPGQTVHVAFALEEDAVMLDNIVVSANRNAVTRREASNIVNVLSGKLFENTNAVCLAQGLNFQSGLRVENNCQNCGFQQVRINGLEGPYSQILIDSRAIFSALAGVYGIEQIPVNMIDRVEVVRGGGSALYGSNAIAGTINIITREPLSNSLTVSNTTLLIGGMSTDINTSMNAAIVSDDFRYGVSLYGSSRQREAWDANGDGFSEIGLINARNIGLRSYFKTSKQSKLTIDYHNLGEFRRGGNMLNLPAHQADVTEQTNHNISTGGAKWDYFTPDYRHKLNIFTSAQHIRRDSYYGAGQDPNAYGLTNDLSFLGGAQYALNIDKLLFMPSEFTAGAEYSLNRLEDIQLSYERQIDQRIDIVSMFLQNEWKTRELSMLMGMRIDQHNLIAKPIVSPRINLRYNPKEWVSLRASYAEGFRAPQAFDEDLHLTAVGGQIQIIVLNPDLRPEHSCSYSVSGDFNYQFGNVKANFLVDGFYTDIDDVFFLEEAGRDAGGNPLLMRSNGSGAVVSGVNLEAKLIPGTKWNIQTGYTIQQSLYKEAESWSENEQIAARREMFRSPNHYGYLTMSFLPVKPMTIALSGIYTGSMLVQHFGPESAYDSEVWTPDFVDLALKISYDIPLSKGSKLQFNTGVQNLLNSFQRDFDTGMDRDSGYIYGPSLPRSWFAGIKLML